MAEFRESVDQLFKGIDRRFDRLERKVDDLADVVQGDGDRARGAVRLD